MDVITFQTQNDNIFSKIVPELELTNYHISILIQFEYLCPNTYG